MSRFLTASAKILLIALPVVGLVVASRWLPRWLLQQVTAAAELQGIQLTNCKLDYTLEGYTRLDHLTLTNCAFATSKPLEVQGEFGKATIFLNGETARSVSVVGLRAKLYGVPDFEEVFLNAEKNSATKAELPPLTLTDGQLTWYSSKDNSTPLAHWTELTHDPATNNWSARVNIQDLAQGAVLLGDQLEMQLSLLKQPQTQLQLEVDPTTSLAKLAIEFKSLALSELNGLLYDGLPQELEAVKLSGSLRLELPFGLNPKQAAGKLHTELDGLNFPVPAELAGLVYGPPVTLDADVGVDRSFSKLVFDPIAFHTGELKMHGRSEITVQEHTGHINATLKGPLSCSAIASSAARSHFDGLTAKLVSQMAKGSLRGSVEIFVILSANTSNLEQARLQKAIGLGCGLKPLPLDQLAELPKQLLEQLPELLAIPRPGQLDKLLKLPPTLQLPNLNELPGLLPKAPRLKAAELAPEPQAK